MRFIIRGKNIEVTDGLREAVESKIGRLEKYFTDDTEVYVTLSVEKGHQKIEVTIPVKGTIIRSEQSSDDMYVSIDLVEEIIERQLRKYKTKLIAKHQDGANFKQDFLNHEADAEEPGGKGICGLCQRNVDGSRHGGSSHRSERKRSLEKSRLR